MKALISILIILGVAIGGYKLYEYWNTVQEEKAAAERVPTISDDQVGRMPWELEESLREAKKKGPSAFKNWITKFEKSPKVPEDRMASIQLEYVVMTAQTDPIEAKRMFAEVKAKVSKTSPVYPKIKALEKTYE
ncbi:MAG TPA: hypothetical protein VGE41_04940 [Verrucomicrobiae bacterium]|jgi:hypothetical protein